MDLRIDPDGTVRCVYDEALDLTVLGSLIISRASDFEPDGEGQWRVRSAAAGSKVRDWDRSAGVRKP